MAVPNAPASPDIPKRSAPEADFDAKMFALFKWATEDFVNFMEAWRAYLETNSTILGSELNGISIGQATPAPGAFTALVAASLGGDAFQSGPLDATTGRALKVGAFGLGAQIPENLADLDSFDTRVGFYGVLPAATGVRPDGATDYGHVLISRSASTAICQIYVNSFNGGLYYRTGVGDTWEGWKEVFSSGSVVGTVSQSAGVPTGALFERGSNANGEFVRYADGTQICWRECSIDVSVTGTGQSFPFPAAFSNGDGGAAGYYDVSSSWSHLHGQPHAALEPANLKSTGHSGTSFIIRLKTAGTSIDPTDRSERMMAMAIGRWF